MRTLLIDNYDSFTYNLFQLVAEVTGFEPVVVKNDSSCWDELLLDDFDAVIISPGPGSATNAVDVGHGADVLARSDVPVLGVCLGHQLIGSYFGAHIEHAPFGPMHGRISEVFHDGSGLFAGLPSPFNAVRYHSLVASELPLEITATAYTSDKELMALSHSSKPFWGVQFHPESVCTDYGAQILRNFFAFVTPKVRPTLKPATSLSLPLSYVSNRLIRWREITVQVTAEHAFNTLFAASPSPTFWLDSALTQKGNARFSYMGDTSGPAAELLTYNAGTDDENVFDSIERKLSDFHAQPTGLPMDFELGYVGYLGYELADPQKSPHPDAQLLFVDRMLAFDHLESKTYLLSFPEGAEEWFDEVETRLQTPSSLSLSVSQTPALVAGSGSVPISPTLRHTREQYLDLIKKCRVKIFDGESYEICLTNMIHAAPLANPLATYSALRASNPAPFAAFLKFNDVCVLSSSPEQFLGVDRTGRVQAKPIKGTAPLGATAFEDAQSRAMLATSEKERAENLMIVDLLRNDLGRVCEVGSVDVPKIFDVESYATVHQLVSTVSGQLRSNLTAVDAVKAAFPGGSMTGAPKVRTMDILNGLESGYRGIYSGAIGYFSLNGAANWSIAIRTMVATSKETTIGVGGAITALSDPAAEFSETLLKAKALLDVIYGAGSPVVDFVQHD